MNNLARYGTAFGLAVVVTLALLWSMQRLIAGGNDVMSEPPRGNVLDFIRLKQEETVAKKERKPQKPPQPKEPPPQMQAPQMQQATPHVDAVSTSFSAELQADTGFAVG